MTLIGSFLGLISGNQQLTPWSALHGLVKKQYVVAKLWGSYLYTGVQESR